MKLLERISLATSVDETWTIAATYFRALGFARINYGLTRFRSERSLGDPDDAVYLSTADAAYMKFYFRGGHFARTPIFRWILQNEGATTWRWVDDAFAAGELSASEENAVRLNRAYGVVAGLTISFPEQNQRTKGALGMIADAGMTHDDVDRIWNESQPEIMALAQMMHLKIASLPARYPNRSLTSRQREALEWVADGKCCQDIATLMGVTVATVEKHLRLARVALNVETTAQAVAKGMLMNMIYVANPRPGS